MYEAAMEAFQLEHNRPAQGTLLKSMGDAYAALGDDVKVTTGQATHARAR